MSYSLAFDSWASCLHLGFYADLARLGIPLGTPVFATWRTSQEGARWEAPTKFNPPWPLVVLLPWGDAGVTIGEERVLRLLIDVWTTIWI